MQIVLVIDAFNRILENPDAESILGDLRGLKQERAGNPKAIAVISAIAIANRVVDISGISMVRSPFNERVASPYWSFKEVKQYCGLYKKDTNIQFDNLIIESILKSTEGAQG